MSGPAAQLGIDSVDGFKLALRKLGDKLGGNVVELVVVDDQLKPEIGVEQVKRLLDKEQGSIIVGTTFSNILMAIVQPVTERQRDPDQSERRTVAPGRRAVQPEFLFGRLSQRPDLRAGRRVPAEERCQTRSCLRRTTRRAGTR